MDVSIGSLQGLAMLFVASGVGVGGKIIFDYLRLNRMPNNKNGSLVLSNFKLMCETQHTNINKSFDVMNGKIDRLDTHMLNGGLKIKSLESDVDEHEKRLEKGIAKFEGIRLDFVQIKNSLAVLLYRSQQRRKTDFTKGMENES